MPSQGVSEIFLQGKQNAAVGSDTEALGGREGGELVLPGPGDEGEQEQHAHQELPTV